MARNDYVIPVKIRIETGRYKFGYVKTLDPDSRGNVRIMYASGRISSRRAEDIIHEPRGFTKREEQYGNDIGENGS